MPLPGTRLTIEKMYQNEYWTNVYFLAGSIGDSASTAASILGAEMAITSDDVLFTKMRLDDNTPDTEVYASSPINLFGLYDLGASQMLPLFNVVRVDFAAGTGRPSRKYLRGILSESDVNFNSILSGMVSTIQTNYATVLAGLAGYVDIDGDEIATGVVHPFVGMRQLRRGSKKKTTPS